MRCLERLGGLPTLQQEPFNVDRQHGDITRAWLADGDATTLDQRVRAVCAGRRLLKHCVELVPWAVTQALMTQASALGFAHLVLYRRQPLDRLLSLAFARRTGVWGPGAAGKARNAVDKAVARALPVRELVAHETLCAQRLADVWRHLQQQGSWPQALAFEDLHGAPREDALRTAAALAHSLRAPAWVGPVDVHAPAQAAARTDARIHAFAAEVVGRGDQRTREHYLRFEGVDALRTALQSVEPFTPDAT